MRTLPPLSCVAALCAGLAFVTPLAAQTQSPVFARLEQYIESLRRHVGIPGLSAAVAANGRIVWERGFGLADVDASVAAAPDTPYHAGGLTQTFTGVLLLECAERGALSLDEPLTRYVPDAPADVTVRQVMSHTGSARPPGSRFDFDLAAVSRLADVVGACTGTDHRLALANLLSRMGLPDSVPGPEWADPPSVLNSADGAMRDRYRQVLRRAATPYRVNRSGSVTPASTGVTQLDGAVGLVSTVRDLVELGNNLERPFPLRSDSLLLMWSPFTTLAGHEAPAGLGWFVQPYNGMRVVWQFGLLPDAGAALLVMVPERRTTFVLLANSDRLNATFDLHDGDLLRSPFAKAFLTGLFP